MTFENPLGWSFLAAAPIVYWLLRDLQRPLRRLVPTLILWRRVPARGAGGEGRSWVVFWMMGAAVLLGLALTGPATPREDAADVHVLLDRSASMGASGRWSEACRAAADALGGRVAVVEFGGGKGVRVDADTLRKGDGPGPARAAFRVEARAAALPAPPGDPLLVVSDRPPPPGWPAGWIQVGRAAPNAGIVAAGVLPEDSGIWAAVARAGGGAARRLVLRDGPGEVLAEAEVGPYASGARRFVLAADLADRRRIELRLEGEDALAADDVVPLVRRGGDLRVDWTGEPARAVARALRAARPGMDLLSGDRAGADLIVFHGILPKAPPDRPYVVLAPLEGRGVVDVRPVVAVGEVHLPQGAPDPAPALQAQPDFRVREATPLREVPGRDLIGLLVAGDDILVGILPGPPPGIVIGFDPEGASDWFQTPDFPIFWSLAMDRLAGTAGGWAPGPEALLSRTETEEASCGGSASKRVSGAMRRRSVPRRSWFLMAAWVCLTAAWSLTGRRSA